jgi:outer membrane protein assembly factor BamB
MSLGIGRTNQVDDTAVSRRTFMRSGVALMAGGCLAHTVTGTAVAQTEDNWPIQGADSENTRYGPETTALESGPSVLAEADIPAGGYADYLHAFGAAYLHSPDSGLGAVDTNTGELLWAFNPDGRSFIPEGIDGDQVLARGSDGNVYTVDTQTGNMSSEVPVGEGYGLGYTGSGRWFAPVSDGAIVAGEVGSQETDWETDIEGVGVRPAVTDDQVFVSTIEAPPEDVDLDDPTSVDAGGRLYALDIDDGSVQWDATRVGASVSEPAVADGTVYWPGSDGDILTRDAETGDSGWEFKIDEPFLPAVAVTEMTVWAGTQEGTLYRLNKNDGSEMGQITLDSAISASPLAVDGAVYVGTEDGSVYAFDTENEEQLWMFDAGAAVRAFAPGNEQVIVGTTDGYHILDTDGSAGGEGSTPAATGGESSTPAATGGTGTPSRQRGLFSNGGDEPDIVSNPFNLTMVGFLLSVAGIAHQMLQGR